jgi:DNA uptake protein ComE-like DNA-binding protein
MSDTQDHRDETSTTGASSSREFTLQIPATVPVRAKRVVSIWTQTQRRTLLALCVILLGFLAIESIFKPARFSDPPPSESPRAIEIADRLDPNTADAAAMAAIPNLGEKRAQQIVDYREKFIGEHPGKRAFDSVDDLLRLKGFGIATVGNLEPYLVFPKRDK